MDKITECTRPKELADESNKDWKDCDRCWDAKCGYSRLFEPNPHWKEQKGCCEWEHCIENMPFSAHLEGKKPERDERSCPVFGHDCPSKDLEKIAECRKEFKKMKLKRIKSKRKVRIDTQMIINAMLPLVQQYLELWKKDNELNPDKINKFFDVYKNLLSFNDPDFKAIAKELKEIILNDINRIVMEKKISKEN